METKHTPGPWHIGMKQAERIVYNAEGWAVANATVYHGEHDAEVMPNARLIAAAPDLLAACEELLAEFENDSYTAEREQGCMGLNTTGGIEMARAAIAKARGK